jgi:tetratricopeptide (TPR) repeat protein
MLLRLRQSEVALADGRLDEAYQLLQSHDLASHRRGQRLVTRLVAEYVKRGNEHLTAGRFVEAIADAQRAATIGGNLPPVVALRTAAANALTTQQRVAHHQQQAIATAQRRIDAGHLESGVRWLGELPDEITRVQLLRHDIEQRKTTAAKAVRAARDAIDRNDFTAAVNWVLKANAADADAPDVASLSSDMSENIVEQIRDALNDGQLARAADLLQSLRKLAPQNADARELTLALRQLRQAWLAIDRGELSDASIQLARAAAQLPKASWLQPAIRQLQQALDAMTQLRTGPLANLAEIHDVTPMDDDAKRSPAFNTTIAPTPRPSLAIPSRFVLHVDGVGAFLILRHSPITIGPVSSSIAADVAVVAEPAAAPIRIERVDEDYFVKSPASTGAAGKLLNSGDRLEISPRCRLTFAVPNPASTTAVLDLTGARLARGDIRRVILMDHDIIIGPAATAHVRADDLSESIVLHATSDGQLRCQAKQALMINDERAEALRAIAINQRLNVAGLSMVLTAV